MEQTINFLGMDMDSDVRAMQPGSYRKAYNIRVNNTATGSVGVVENLRGNTLIEHELPAGTNECIGSYEDKQGNRVIFFFSNSNGMHCICQYEAATNMVDFVFEGECLNFSPDHRVTGVAMEGDLLYWTDNYNPPRKINVARARAGFYNSIMDTEKYFLNMLVPPPSFPMRVEKQLDATYPNNYIRDANLQFTYRYQYLDNEYSILGPASRLVPQARLSIPDDRDRNRVLVEIPVEESISKLVKQIEYLYRIGNNGKWQVFKTVNRATAPNGDPVDFSRQIYFYNDTVAYGISEAEAIKPHEAVPLKASALASVKNRIFLGGLTEGYDRTSVAMTVSVEALTGPEGGVYIDREIIYVRRWGEEYAWDDFTFTFVYQGSYDRTNYYMVHENGKYYPTSYESGLDVWTWADYGEGSGYTYAYITEPTTFTPGSDANGNPVDNPSTEQIDVVSMGIQQTYDALLGTPIESLEAQKIFKGNSSYQVGVLFKDYGARNNGVADGEQQITFPGLPTDIANQKTRIRWQLTTVPMVRNEIPVWATHYHIVRTKNQSMATFIQGYSADVVYVNKPMVGSEAGTTVFSRTYSSAFRAIWVDISTLNHVEIGYNFSEGDRLRLFKDNKEYDMEIVSQQGKYLELVLHDIGALLGGAQAMDNNYRFEVYTPYKPGEAETFYEVGRAYPVLNAGLESRDYSIRDNVVEGDCYLIKRKYVTYKSTYVIGDEATHEFDTIEKEDYVEATSPNDRYWTTWDSNISRPTVKLVNSMEVEKKAAIRFGNTYLPGTAINGLSEFEPLNEMDLDEAHGRICFLQQVGHVMLAFQEQETITIYVGEQQFSDANGQSLIAVSDRILGSHRPLRGSWGCLHPASIQEQDGYVYWYCHNKKAILRYANDGVTPISGYGIESFLNTMADPDKVKSYIDPLHGEYVISFQRSGSFDTLAFQERSNRWTSFYSFMFEESRKVGKKALVSFKNGSIWLHDTGPYNQYYGAGVASSITMPSAAAPDLNKIFMNIRIEADSLWTASPITTIEGQLSELAAVDFLEMEGQYCANFLRDQNTPNKTYPILEGDVLRSAALLVTLNLSDNSNKHQLREVKIGFEKS